MEDFDGGLRFLTWYQSHNHSLTPSHLFPLDLSTTNCPPHASISLIHLLIPLCRAPASGPPPSHPRCSPPSAAPPASPRRRNRSKDHRPDFDESGAQLFHLVSLTPNSAPVLCIPSAASSLLLPAPRPRPRYRAPLPAIASSPSPCSLRPSSSTSRPPPSRPSGPLPRPPHLRPLLPLPLLDILYRDDSRLLYLASFTTTRCSFVLIASGCQFLQTPTYVVHARLGFPP